ncbi:MAG: choice-of-anchor J domain-containing protein [Flavobacterium sp.]
MKKTLLFSLLLVCISINAQVTIFQESFETYNDFIISDIGGWITIDLDGSSTYAGGGGIDWPNRFQPQAFQIFNPIAAEVTNNATGNDLRNFDPRPGSQKYAGSWAAVMPGDGAGGAGPNNDWLVSPAMTLGTADNTLKFWVKSMSSSYGLETYRVAVFVGDGVPTGPSDFTIISGGANLIAPYPNWEERTFNLDAYSNQTIRVAIHCNSVDRYFFLVDDFIVTSASLSTENFFTRNLKLYPNPANNQFTLSSTTSLIENVSIVDLNGRVVKNINVNSLSSLEANTSNLSSGMYFVNVETNIGKGSTKLIIK